MADTGWEEIERRWAPVSAGLEVACGGEEMVGFCGAMGIDGGEMASSGGTRPRCSS